MSLSKHVLVTLASVATLTAGLAVAAQQDPKPSLSPVVVELFTSQGCSSCPPADRLLSQLGQQGDVIALSFHVDYWNYIGWQDPFSSPAWSQRQRSYAQALASRRVYTPQLVVGGVSDCVGSDRAEVERQLARARRQAQAGRVEVAATAGKKSWLVDLDASILDSTGGKSLDLLLAVVENRLETRVSAGENARRTLHNSHVVRRLDKVAALEAVGGERESLRVPLSIDPSWNVEEIELVAFLQDPETLEIHGAGTWVPGD